MVSGVVFGYVSMSFPAMVRSNMGGGGKEEKLPGDWEHTVAMNEAHGRELQVSLLPWEIHTGPLKMGNGKFGNDV